MSDISKTFTFEAAHQLPGHFGKCSRLHGHSYELEVVFSGHIKECALNPDGSMQTDAGMVKDFYDISTVMKPILEDYLDHHFLNETLIGIPRTTAELIACWIFGALYVKGIEPSRVIVYETASSMASVNYRDWTRNGSLGPVKPALIDMFEKTRKID